MQWSYCAAGGVKVRFASIHHMHYKKELTILKFFRTIWNIFDFRPRHLHYVKSSVFIYLFFNIIVCPRFIIIIIILIIILFSFCLVRKFSNERHLLFVLYVWLKANLLLIAFYYFNRFFSQSIICVFKKSQDFIITNAHA